MHNAQAQFAPTRKITATSDGSFGWSVPEYAAHWGVTRGCVHGWLKRGELGSVKLGGLRRILPEHHQQFCERHESKAFA